MSRSEWFIRITRKNCVQLVNASAIHHAEYRNTPDAPSVTRAELIIWFSDDEGAQALSMYGDAATVAWNALNELTIRAVFSVGD